MPITISGSTGIAGVDGSAGTPAVQGTDTNTGIFFPAADTIAFGEGGSEAMRIDSSGNVGIGTSSPSSRLHVSSSTSSAAITVGNSSGTSEWQQNGNDLYLSNYNASGAAIFRTNSAERARITSIGDFLIGTNSTIGPATAGLHVVNGGEQIRIKHTSNANYWRFVTDSNNTAYIVNQSTTGVFIANGGSSWSGLSDERHKDIIEPITDAVEKVSTLRTVIGKFKTDDDGVRRSFLIAQDVQKVLPEAVHHADQDRLGLAYTEVIPLLTAAIKELTAKLEAAEARIATLEAR